MADMSFLPEDYLERRNQRRTNIVSLSLFAVVMTAVIGAFFVTDRERVKVRDLQHQVNTEYTQVAAELDQLEKLQERKKEMIRKAKITSQLVERIPRSLVLAELVNSMPTTLSLLDMDMVTEDVKKARSHAATAMDRAKEQRKKSGTKKGEQAEDEESELPTVKPSEVKLQLTGVAPTDVQVAQYMTTLGQSPMFTDLNLVFSEETKINDRVLRKFHIEMKLSQNVSVDNLEPKMVKRVLKQNPMANTIQINSDGSMVLPPEDPSLHSDANDSNRRIPLQD